MAAPWTVACQAPLSTGFPRQEYWSRLPFPPPNDLPNPGVKPVSPASSALAGRFFTTEPPGKPQIRIVGHFYYLLSFIFLFPLEFSCVLHFVTPWTVARQAPLSMGFPRQEYWSRLPLLSPGDLPDPGIEPVSPTLQADAFNL